jgi:SH3-like domain-containing protein
MIVRTGLALVVVVLLGGVAVAEDDKVKANQKAELFSEAGESSRVLTKIKEGQAMTVVKREGRWLRVRVKGRTGWVPRSKVDDVTGGITRNTRRRPFVDGRSTGRGFTGGAPEDRIGLDAVDNRDDDDDDGEMRPRSRDDDDDDDDDDRGRSRDDDDDDDDDDRDRDRDDDDREEDSDDAEQEEERPTVKIRSKRVSLYAEPSKKSDELGTAKKGKTFYFMREDDGWVLIENDEGDAFWVRESDVSSPSSGDSGGPFKRQLRGNAAAGFKLIGQRVKTEGGNPVQPDNYELGTSSATLGIGFEALYPYGEKYRVGGEASYVGSKAVPGIAVDGVNTGLTIHDFDIRVNAGYDLKNAKGMVAFARLGYHYENFAVSNVTDLTQNPAKIPSEVFQGPVLGAALHVAKLSDKIAMRAMLDTIVFGGKRKQTVGLEDGMQPKTKAAWLTTCFAYRWKPDMTIDGIYELTLQTTQFGDQNPNGMRHSPGVGETSRRDLNHTITVGLSKMF